MFVGDQRATVGAVIGFLDRAVTGGALRAALRRADRKNAAGTGWDSLTPSEQEVARLIASGLIASVTVPALVISGDQSPPFLRASAQAVADALPNGRLSTLAGQGHDISPEATAPVMTEFLAS